MAGPMLRRRPRARLMPVRAAVVAPALALVVALAATARAEEPAGPARQKPTERWYEVLVNGQKIGFTRIAWSPSTYEGRRTVRDQTTVVYRSVRDMAGIETLFETHVALELERGADGTLWMMKVVTQEAERLTVEELTWTGEGYRHVVRVGRDEPQVTEHPVGEPVMTDAEAFLSGPIQRGEVAVGQTFRYRALDRRAREARVHEVSVVAREEVEGKDGPVSCLRVVDRDPSSGARTTLWLDADGAFVQIRTEGGAWYREVDRERAEEMPVEPATYSVMVPSTPGLERVFNADRLRVDVHIQGDPHREVPRFPPSPWSRELALRGSDEEGWVASVALTRYDDLTVSATLPIVVADEPALDGGPTAADLEATPLMPAAHPRLRAKAREVIGDVTDARQAAWLLARFVHGSLAKESPDVGDATALEILDEMRGDCSEHCVLFVALCRAAGIPARRVTGFVSIGSQWGAHAWAEVWVGGWIGADPTTGEVGSAARYLFFGYPDVAGSYPGLISGQAAGRLRFVVTELEEAGRVRALTDEASHVLADPERGRFEHVLAGLEAHDVPPDWRVRFGGSNYGFVAGGALRATLRAFADQGETLDVFGGANATYAGAPALMRDARRERTYWVHSRRRLIELTITGGTEEERATLERILAPTFAPALKD